MTEVQELMDKLGTTEEQELEAILDSVFNLVVEELKSIKTTASPHGLTCRAISYGLKDCYGLGLDGIRLLKRLYLKDRRLDKALEEVAKKNGLWQEFEKFRDKAVLLQ